MSLTRGRYILFFYSFVRSVRLFITAIYFTRLLYRLSPFTFFDYRFADAYKSAYRRIQWKKFFKIVVSKRDSMHGKVRLGQRFNTNLGKRGSRVIGSRQTEVLYEAAFRLTKCKKIWVCQRPPKLPIKLGGMSNIVGALSMSD